MGKQVLKIYHSGEKNAKKIEGLIDLSKYKVLEINILKDKFTATCLLQLSNKIGVNLIDLVDKKNDFYKNNFSHSRFDEADWVRILIEHPTLIRTPIVESSNEAEIIVNPQHILTYNL